MRKLFAASSSIALLLAAVTVCQASPTTTQDKMEVRVNDSGNQVTTPSGQLLTVADPWVLQGHENQRVELKCRTEDDENKIEIDKVVKGYPWFWINWPYLHYQDSAFRK